jgi:hypothetical protein
MQPDAVRIASQVQRSPGSVAYKPSGGFIMSDTNAAPTFEKEIKTSAEKYKQEGRTFSPFIFKIHSAADLLDNHVLWTNGSVCFYKVPGSDGFLPLGIRFLHSHGTATSKSCSPNRSLGAKMRWHTL